MASTNFITSSEVAFSSSFCFYGVIKDKLYHWGYHFTDIATTQSEVSFRGDIIDMYPIDASSPYRISLFDEEIEAIQYYDADTQKRSSDELEFLSFTPAFFRKNSSGQKFVIDD